MSAGDNKALSATCAGCGKAFPSQRHPNQPQITGVLVRVKGVLRNVPLCRTCIEQGVKAEEVAPTAA
ncbi:MAG: hypothetical protein HY699_22315 [Deltaproteobacteria bacterium]|nr:hypothetical protein [Deltaproteobacteria bacterium]